jgi:hypothetical protein
MPDTILVIDPEGGPPTSRPATPEEQAQIDADRAAGAVGQVRQQQAAADDTERLRTINERARTDPAYAALVDYVLRGVQRP